ncbi:MAG TPA: AAA family ATPase [Gaiellaceae bacterium]|nr:AAA family ATPase [Gaiellaceae bacterium]
MLLSGSAAAQLGSSLANEPTLRMVQPIADGNGGRLSSPVDVALHVVHSSSDELGDDIGKVRALSQAPLILAAYGEPNGIVETGLQVGAADVLVLPQPVETVLFALRKAAVATAPETAAAKVVTVFSPKGGAGKTVLATNIAVAAQQAGLRTLLMDLDLQFGDAALTLAVPPRATIADLAGSSGDIDVEKLKAFVCTDPRSSLTLLPAPKRPEEAQIVGQAELGAALNAARASYSAVVVDTGPLFDAAMLAALDRTDTLLLVCNPEVTSLKNVRIGLETIERLGFPQERVSIVANRIGAAGAVTRAEIEDALEREIAFELPDDAAVPEAVNRATPAMISDPGSRFARAVSAVAKSVFAGLPSETASAPKSARRSLLGGRR